MQPHALDNHLALAGAFDVHAHGAKRGQGRQGILPFEKAAHPGFTLRERAEHNGAMGNGLVARDPRFPVNGATGVEVKFQDTVLSWPAC